MRSTDEPGFDGKVAALKGIVLHHVDEEESELLPEAKKLLGTDALDALGQQMEAQTEIMKSEGNARYSVREEIQPPSIQP